MNEKTVFRLLMSALVALCIASLAIMWLWGYETGRLMESQKTMLAHLSAERGL